MLEPYRVYLAPGGWRVTDGVKEYGSFDSHATAVKTADSLNRSWAPQETRTFASEDAEFADVWGGRDDRFQESGRR